MESPPSDFASEAIHVSKGPRFPENNDHGASGSLRYARKIGLAALV
jgi:hypothetical protein